MQFLCWWWRYHLSYNNASMDCVIWEVLGHAMRRRKFIDLRLCLYFGVEPQLPLVKTPKLKLHLTLALELELELEPQEQ